MYADGRGYAPSPGGSRLPPPLPSPSGRASFPKSLSDKYRLGEELGRGAFGQVYLGLDTRTGEHVAIKQLSLERIPTENLQGIMNEVELLKALNHRNIVKYIGSFKTKTHLYIILEFMENGALSSVIKQSKFGPFPESLVAVYIQQGLAYLHDQGVVHRDIKGANILTTKEGLVKLADFGVAAKLAELEVEAQAGVERNSSLVGTPYWMAPEVVEMQSVSTASDIWSVGCLAVELLTGSPPYYDLQPMSALYNIVQDPHPPLPADISSGMRDFLLQCFQKDPAARPTARDLLQHSWITYNRRTLKSSWSRTRGLKTQAGGPLAEGYTSVSTVVERILQSAADSEAGTMGAATAAAGSAAGPDSLASFEQQARSQAAAAVAPGPILGNAAALAPVAAAAAGARQSAFSLPAAAAAGAGQAASLLASSPAGTAVQGAWGAKLPPPPVFPGGAEQQQQQQQQAAGGELSPGAAGARHRRLWSGAVAGPPPLGGTVDARPLAAAQPAQPAQQVQQNYEAEEAISSSDDPCGEGLLEQLEAASAGSAGSPARARSSSSSGGGWPGSAAKTPSLATVAENDALAVEASAQSRHEVAEVKRQVAGMRILVFAAGERSFVQEAAAAASCRTLLGLLSRDPQLRATFLEVEGLSALRELLDNPSDRVLEAALDLLLLLAAADGAALLGCCRLGFIPAVLRFALPSTPIDLRMQAGAFAEVLCRASLASAQQVVACQGVPFIRDMIDEQQQPLHPQQADLAATAVSCFWLLLRRTQQPGWPLSSNQLLRLYAHHNLPLRLVRLLPRLLQAHAQAAAAAAEARGAAAAQPAPSPPPAPRHARAVSMPQSEAEMALLGNDELAAAAASLALTRGAGEDAGSGGSGAASPERAGSPRRRWLGRALPSSPSRLSRMRSSRPAAGPPEHAQNGAGAAAAAAPPPVPPQVEAEQRLSQLVDSLVNLLAAMAHGDSSVKARLCQREVLAGMMGLAGHLRPHLQLRVLRWVRQLATDQLVLQALEEAGAVAYVVAQLQQPERLGLQADALGALHSLCQLSRSRQELAAEQKAVAPLVQLARQPPAAALGAAAASPGEGSAAAAAAAAAATTRGLAVSLLCGFAHGGPRSRQEMWGAGGFDALVELLKEEAHQLMALDALAAWLEAEPPRVEALLLDREALDRLVMLLPAGTAAAATASPGGDGEQLQSLLTSLARLLQRSPRLAVELAQNGLAARVVELLKRPGATAALSLLQILRAMYEHHPRPKEFIVKYRVQQTLAALAHGQSAANQVLVRKQAQNLLDAFQVNVVF